MKTGKQRAAGVSKVVSCTASVLAWVMIWHLAAKCINNEIFLPSPEKVIMVLVQDLLPAENFQTSLLASLMHIGAGFIIGSMAGILLAIASFASGIVRAFLWFPLKVVKSVPVASFVILALLWLDGEGLTVFVPALIVLPTLYINTLTGLQQTDDRFLDVAKVFELSLGKKIGYIYIPQALPYVLSAASLAMGMAWKAGVAAEIIGLVKHSIGNELYKAKIYLMIPELFAWTFVIVVLSVLCESVIKLLLHYWEQK